MHEGKTSRRPPVSGTGPKTSSAGLALLLLSKKERLTPADCALRLHCDAHLDVALDGLTTCPGHPMIAGLIRYTHAYV